MKNTNVLSLKSFYLGANTPKGFISYFDTVGSHKNNWYRFLIKSGPGTGKSSLMRKVANELSGLSKDMELIYCSSDPDSLDGVILPEKKIMIVDATSPHVLEPVYPGTYDKIVSLYEMFDYNKLRKNQQEIKNLGEENLFYQLQAVNVLSAAYGLIKNNYDVLDRFLDIEKLNCFADKFLRDDLKILYMKSEQGVEEKRFLTAITPTQCASYKETVNCVADNVYILKDSTGVVSGKFLSKIRSALLDSGVDIITCNCAALSGEKIDHILIPNLNVAVVTSNEYHDFDDIDNGSIIYCNEFLSNVNKSLKERVENNKEKIYDMICDAKLYIGEAKIVHENLEKYYIEAVDFKQVDHEAERTIKMMKDLINMP